MDMNWTDEIRDPEPLKRPIYNAADYDTRHGDPYYREHSTRADSLWRLYEESGTSITFDAFADESRQTDYRMETGALRNFFNGSQSALSSYRNPMGGNPLIAFGVIGRWDGERTGISSFETFDDLMNGDDSPFKDCEIDHIWDENGILKMRGHHHDGSVEVEIHQLTDQGCEALESYEQAWAGEPFDAAGRRYDGGKESVDRFWNDMETDRGLSVEPRYVELAFGCPPIEWDIDARVRDFAERMGDEYSSLYEQDTTGIKGGDFERFGAFADNHLDFIRALTKPMDTGEVESTKTRGTPVLWPADFQLAGVMLRCPCGMTPESCRCTERDKARYHLPGLFEERCAIRIDSDAIRSRTAPGLADARAMVADARARQEARFAGTAIESNNRIGTGWLEEHTPQEVLGLISEHAGTEEERLALNTARLTWTMADLGGHAVPDEDDALKALGMTMGDETIQKAEDRTPLVCDPSGTLNLDQASPYGMTR